MISRVAFFHGLESLPRTEKNEMLEKEFDFVFAPPMDYYNPLLFDNVLPQLFESNLIQTTPFHVTIIANIYRLLGDFVDYFP